MQGQPAQQSPLNWKKRGSVWMGAFHPSNNPNSFGPSIYLGLHQTCYLRYGFMIWGLGMRIRNLLPTQKVLFHLCPSLPNKWRKEIFCWMLSCNISAEKAWCNSMSQRIFYKSKNFFQNITWYSKFRKNNNKRSTLYCK